MACGQFLPRGFATVSCAVFGFPGVWYLDTRLGGKNLLPDLIISKETGNLVFFYELFWFLKVSTHFKNKNKHICRQETAHGPSIWSLCPQPFSWLTKEEGTSNQTEQEEPPLPQPPCPTLTVWCCWWHKPSRGTDCALLPTACCNSSVASHPCKSLSSLIRQGSGIGCI